MNSNDEKDLDSSLVDTSDIESIINNIEDNSDSLDIEINKAKVNKYLQEFFMAEPIPTDSAYWDVINHAFQRLTITENNKNAVDIAAACCYILLANYAPADTSSTSISNGNISVSGIDSGIQMIIKQAEQMLVDYGFIEPSLNIETVNANNANN